MKSNADYFKGFFFTPKIELKKFNHLLQKHYVTLDMLEIFSLSHVTVLGFYRQLPAQGNAAE